ncbi:hypothetical protein FRC01_013027, partial [Tulasnella sp. 417]
MDEILGATRQLEIYVVLETLSTNLQQLPAHICDFCQTTCEYPDESFREELARMVSEARLRGTVSLEHDLDEITLGKYFENIEYWFADIEEEALRDYIENWADTAADLGDACQIASRAVDRLSAEWSVIGRWIQDVGMRGKHQEENAAVHLWSIWRFDSEDHVSYTPIALTGCLEAILRSIQDLKQTVDRLGSFWDKLSSDIRA